MVYDRTIQYILLLKKNKNIFALFIVKQAVLIWGFIYGWSQQHRNPLQQRKFSTLGLHAQAVRAQLGRYLERPTACQEEESGIQVPEGGFTDIENVGLNS